MTLSTAAVATTCYSTYKNLGGRIKTTQMLHIISNETVSKFRAGQKLFTAWLHADY
jgi:hypothetical protein